MSKKERWTVDEVRAFGAARHYIRARKTRQDTIVQVWLNKEAPRGEPDGDWCMPKMFPLDVAIDQAVMQS